MHYLTRVTLIITMVSLFGFNSISVQSYPVPQQLEIQSVTTAGFSASIMANTLPISERTQYYHLICLFGNQTDWDAAALLLWNANEVQMVYMLEPPSLSPIWYDGQSDIHFSIDSTNDTLTINIILPEYSVFGSYSNPQATALLFLGENQFTDIRNHFTLYLSEYNANFYPYSPYSLPIGGNFGSGGTTRSTTSQSENSLFSPGFEFPFFLFAAIILIGYTKVHSNK